MAEDYFMRCRVYATFGWLVAATFMTAGWIMLLFDGGNWRIAAGLGVTGVAITVVAATLQVRAFHVRVCSLIRATRGISPREAEDGSLRPLR